MRQLTLWLAPMALAVALSGCSVYRGIPTHGGGKRFDEEQAVVSRAARHTLEQMDFSALKGKRVAIFTISMAHNGGGAASFPRITSIAGEANRSKTDTDYDYNGRQLLFPWITPYYEESKSNYRNFGGSIEVRPSMDYYPFSFATDSDLEYLEGTLALEVIRQGAILDFDNAEVSIVALVNVFGTNRNRRWHLLYWVDRLDSTCEITYYARSLTSNTLIVEPQSVAARARYQESSVPGFLAFRKQRTVQSFQPNEQWAIKDE